MSVVADDNGSAYIDRLGVHREWSVLRQYAESPEAAFEELADSEEWDHLDADDYEYARLLLDAGHPVEVIAERLWRINERRREQEEYDLEVEDEGPEVCPHCGGEGYV